MRHRWRWLIVTALLATLAACSPEDQRARGGGPGADVGNHADPILPNSKLYSSRKP